MNVHACPESAHVCNTHDMHVALNLWATGNVHEVVIDNSKSKLFKHTLEYWKNNKQHYIIRNTR